MARKDTEICSLDNCDSAFYAKELCSRHYKQVRIHGRVLTKKEISESKRQNRLKGSGSSGMRWKIKDTSNMMGKHPKTEFKKGYKSWNKGTSDWMAKAHKEALKRASIGRSPWNKGKEVKDTQGEKNWIWAGDKVSYRSLHKWVERHKGKPDTCENCLESGLTGRKIHWSNISGAYKRDLNDWQRLCASCHGAYDSGKLTLAEIRG